MIRAQIGEMFLFASDRLAIRFSMADPEMRSPVRVAKVTGNDVQGRYQCAS